MQQNVVRVRANDLRVIETLRPTITNRAWKDFQVVVSRDKIYAILGLKRKKRKSACTFLKNNETSLVRKVTAMFSSKTVNDLTESIIHFHRRLFMYEDLPLFIK